MPAPTFISATAAANSTSNPITTASIAVQNNDVLVAFVTAEQTTTGTINSTVSTASGSTSAWTKQQFAAAAATNQQAYLALWTATATATGNITVAHTLQSGTNLHLLIVKVWRNSGGVGASNIFDSGTTQDVPSVSVTTTGTNSGLDYGDADWNTNSGTITFTASDGTPVSDFSDQTGVGQFTYSSHVLDAGTSGLSKTMGMSSPTTQRYINAVIEVLGTTAVAWLPSNDPSSVIMGSFYKETMIGY